MEALHLRKEILKVIQNVAKKNGIQNHKITSVQTNAKGEGFLGEIFMVSVTDANSSDRQLDMVIKAAFQDDTLRTALPMIRQTFENEIYFYRTVLPAFTKFIEEHGCKPPGFVAKCLEVSLASKAEFLVLENLKIKGFETRGKSTSLDDDHIKLIFHTYGKLHGISFSFGDEYPEEVEEFNGNMANIYEGFTRMEGFDDNSKQFAELILKHLESTNQLPEVIEKFKRYTKGENSSILSSATRRLDYSCILHGDCWSNNLMFKYQKSEDGERKPVSIRLLDWQLIFLGSPACDLTYCLYSGGSKKLYDNLDEYLKIYYDSFSKTVQELGKDPEKVYPFAVLKEQWKECSRMGLIMAIAIWCIKLTKSEDIKDIQDLKDSDMKPMDVSKATFDREEYYRQMEDIIVHMHEIGAL